MRKTEILCIFSTILGHKTVSKRLVAAIESSPDVHPTYVFIGPEDHARYPVPFWAHISNPWESIFVARRKAHDIIDKPFDALLLNTWELSVAFRGLVKRLPTGMIADAVPTTIDAALRRRGEGGLKRWIGHRMNQRSFAKAVQHIDYFLIKSSVCSESLQRDFGISRQRCFVTLAPQDLCVFKPRADGPGTREKPIRLLFIGNDFVRKGGSFLIELYAKHLKSYSSLTIVSTDPSLPKLQFPDGVRLISGLPREQLVDVYQNSDLFVFPTRQDYTPEVVAEALAIGLPCLVGDVDGARDLIRNGENGFILPPDTSPELWVSHIRRLSENPEELAKMSSAARRFAEQYLSIDRFNSTIRDVVGRLRAGGPAL